MTDATLERIAPDPFRAADFLDRARGFARDGTVDSIAAESRRVLLHGAVIAACDAVLSIKGFRVVGTSGSHRLRLDKAEELLPSADASLFERLDDARVARNEISYAAVLVPSVDVEAVAATVRDLPVLVEALVGPRLLDWRTSGSETP